MPHKHTRRAAPLGKRDEHYDLPPNALAKALPVGKITKSKKLSTAQASKSSESSKYHQDDTPREFLRLVNFSKHSRGGLDDGKAPPSKKRKRGQADSKADDEKIPSKNSDIPSILPGERFSDFSARVNQALPISGLNRKGRKQPGLKERQTKTERRMQKMQEEWRREEAKLKEKEEDARDLADEKDAEDWNVREATSSANSRKGKAPKGSAKEMDDPWAVIKAKRGKQGGLNDVAKAPPEFKRLPKEKFKFKNGAKVNVDNVPTAAGSLRQREELGETRRSIIESYRKMMEDRRAGET